ncbi:MAG: lipopolysaccharide assembly protein LapA domain-containing protein [Thiomonas sp.]|uniref:Lipopolysaccharide assembly protein A domain-containing protein n=1 Tax=mine drainage metagenome TaxID=410659 RepID=E6PRK1_9ZZZZ
MRALNWFVRLILFLLLFGLALNNLEPTVLHLLFGTQWTAPLFVLLLAAFTLGAVLGALAMLPGWMRARRTQVARNPGPNMPALEPQEQAPVRPVPTAIDGSTPDGV